MQSGKQALNRGKTPRNKVKPSPGAAAAAAAAGKGRPRVVRKRSGSALRAGARRGSHGGAPPAPLGAPALGAAAPCPAARPSRAPAARGAAPSPAGLR